MTKVWVWKSHEFASPDFTVAFQLFFTRILAIFNFEFLLPPLRHLQKTVHFSLTVAICLIQIPLRSEHLLCPLSTVLALNTGPCTWNYSPWINNLGAEDHLPFFSSVPILSSSATFISSSSFHSFRKSGWNLSWQHPINAVTHWI